MGLEVVQASNLIASGPIHLYNLKVCSIIIGIQPDPVTVNFKMYDVVVSILAMDDYAIAGNTFYCVLLLPTPKIPWP